LRRRVRVGRLGTVILFGPPGVGDHDCPGDWPGDEEGVPPASSCQQQCL
jgi:hypothetical protein